MGGALTLLVALQVHEWRAAGQQHQVRLLAKPLAAHASCSSADVLLVECRDAAAAENLVGQVKFSGVSLPSVPSLRCIACWTGCAKHQQACQIALSALAKSLADGASGVQA